MIRLILYEFQKHFCKRSLLVILLLLSMVDLLKIQSEYQSYSFLNDGKESGSWHTVYWELYSEYSGKITLEKIDKLLSVYEPLAEATADLTASTEMDNPDTMTGNLYSDCNLLKKYYVDPMRYFYEYKSAANQVAQKAKENTVIYGERGQTYEVRKNSRIYHLYADRQIPFFAYREMYNYYLNYDFSTVLILLLCLYAIVGVFNCERETQMDLLILTAKNGGRKTTATKIIAVSFFAIAVSLWFSICDYVGFAISFETTEGFQLPVFALSSFAGASVNVSLLQYSVLSAAVRAAGVWEIGLLMLLISMCWKNILVPFATDFSVCLILIITGTASAYSGSVWLKCFNPYSLLANRILFGKTEFLNLLGYPVLSYTAAIVCTLVLGLAFAAVILLLSAQNCYHGRKR